MQEVCCAAGWLWGAFDWGSLAVQPCCWGSAADGHPAQLATLPMLAAAGGAAAAGEVSVFELTLTAKDEFGQPLPARDSARVKVRMWLDRMGRALCLQPLFRLCFELKPTAQTCAALAQGSDVLPCPYGFPKRAGRSHSVSDA